MPEHVPFQTHTRHASRRAAAGQAPYPAAALSSSPADQSSPQAPAPSSRTSAASSQPAKSSPTPNRPARRRAAPQRAPASASGSKDRRTNATRDLGSSQPAVPAADPNVDGFDPRGLPRYSHDVPSRGTVISKEVDLASLRQPTPLQTPTSAPHQIDPRPFLSPIITAQRDTRQPNESIFLPEMPPSPRLEQVYPNPLRPVIPSLPSSGLQWLRQDAVYPTEEMDIANHNLSVLGNDVGTDYIFPELRGSQLDTEILFPELEASRLNIHNPHPWSFPSRRDPSELCRSAICPLSLAAHNEGLYLHEGRESNHPNPTFGRSNPPPSIWQALIRIMESHEQPSDRKIVWAFSRCHRSL